MTIPSRTKHVKETPRVFLIPFQWTRNHGCNIPNALSLLNELGTAYSGNAGELRTPNFPAGYQATAALLPVNKYLTDDKRLESFNHS